MDMLTLLELMIKYEASDLYLTVGVPPMYRVNGTVRPAGVENLEEEDVKQLIYGVMSDKQQSEYQSEQEINLALHYKDLGRFRMNAYIQRSNHAAVIRHINSKILTIPDLDLPPILEKISMLKRGLVLVVGATGSGKSTTLAAMIKHRSENSNGHIITIEDPIEFIHQHSKSIISQREVGMDTVGFKVALKNAVRQSPDVVLLGEIRDIETMEAAIHFSETGHLCLATLHSNNAYQTIERVMNFFPPEQHRQIYTQLGLNLKAVISQRLVPTVDDSRVAALELMTDSPRIKDLIQKGEITNLWETIEKSQQFNMQSFDQALYDLYEAGKITLEVALKNADSANNLRLRVKLSQKSKGNKSIVGKKPGRSKGPHRESKTNLELA